MLHAAETWVMKVASLNCSRRNDCVRFFQKISKGHNSPMGDNCNKKNKDELFSYEASVYQISIVWLQRFKSYNIYKKNCGGRTDRRVKSNMPLQLFKVWGA